MAVSAIAITAIVPAWTGSETTRSTASVIEPTMFSAMTGMPTSRSSSAAVADVAAHDRAGQDEQPCPRQVRHGADRGRDVLLADERDRVHADPLAAQVVAIGLADGAERDLGDLRAAADDDDPLAEDPVEGARQVPVRTFGSRLERRDEGVLGQPLDLELDLDDRRVAVDPSDGRERPDPPAGCRRSRHRRQR